MGFVTDVITPIIKTTLLVGFLFWIIFMVWWGAYKIFTPQRRLWIRYKLFKKTPHEDDVAWIMDKIDRKLSANQIRKSLMLSGTSLSRTEEILFIYDEIQKLEGGEENARLKTSNAKTKLPKI